MDLFKTRLEGFSNSKHELYRQAHLIDCDKLDEEFGKYFDPDKGVPLLPTRLISGLHFLKPAKGLSGEAVVECWIENSYWQYFCGE